MGLTSIWREKPCKKNDKKRQKSEVEPSSNRRERERERKLLKKSRSVFKKPNSRYSIDRKTVWINRKSGKTSF